MSRMTKFLKQTCLLEQYSVTSDGNIETNRFGEIVYKPAIKCKCRHEVCFKDVQTTNGSVVRSVARYFLDEKVALNPDYRLDGNVILSVETYINEHGSIEGYEVYI